MKIFLNHEPVDIHPAADISEILASRQLNPETVVVLLNGQIIPQDAAAAVVPLDGDELTVLTFVGGG